MLVGLHLSYRCYNFSAEGQLTYLQQKKKLSSAASSINNNLAAI
jgi:hypothetical protein